MKSIQRLLTNRPALLALFVVIAIFAALQSYFGSLKTFEDSPILYTRYNNYIIFKQSFFHLIEQKDLYILYLHEQWDLYKYSPAFALIFGTLAILPDGVGLVLWALMNCLVLFYAVYYLPHFDDKTKALILLFVLPEMLLSMQNEQSNALIAGLLIFAFGLLENRKYWLASLCVVATVFIKLFGLVGFALYLLYPNKLKLGYTTLVWMVFFTILPLVAVNTETFLFLYQSWWKLLGNDHSISDGLSVIGWLKSWFGWSVNKTYVSAAGVLLFCLTLLRVKLFSQYTYRVALLASILIWVVIFNHRAESPTFIIAVSGVALWYFSQRQSVENGILFLLVFIFTCLSSTDLCPRFLKEQWVNPYVLKAVPCIFVWGKITIDLLLARIQPRILETDLHKKG